MGGTSVCGHQRHDGVVGSASVHDGREGALHDTYRGYHGHHGNGHLELLYEMADESAVGILAAQVGVPGSGLDLEALNPEYTH